jgi:hypothetical protein
MAWQPGGRKARTNGPRHEERTRPTCGPRCIAKFGFLKKILKSISCMGKIARQQVKI